MRIRQIFHRKQNQFVDKIDQSGTYEKIGFIGEINHEIASTKQYKEYLEMIGDIEEGVIEVKKEWVYKQ